MRGRAAFQRSRRGDYCIDLPCRTEQTSCCVIPNTHRRRRRELTVELSCVGGVYWALAGHRSVARPARTRSPVAIIIGLLGPPDGLQRLLAPADKRHYTGHFSHAV